MDFWDGSTSPSVLKDNSDSSAEYERNFATPRDTINYAGQSEAESRAMACTDYRMFGSSSDLIMLTSDHDRIGRIAHLHRTRDI